jgi:hypothetical protein
MGKRKAPESDTESFLKKSAKRIIVSPYWDQDETKKKWNEAKSKLVKSDFPKAYYYDKKQFKRFKPVPARIL